MRWVKFPDGGEYTFAADIQDTAEKYGYTVPCEADGTRHPGTDCNAKMRTVIKDIGLRRTFGVTDVSVVDVRMHDSVHNEVFMKWLVDNGLVSDSYLKIGVIQLYSKSAVDALLSVMLKAESRYEPKGDRTHRVPFMVTKRSHNFEKKKNKPKASLFKK